MKSFRSRLFIATFAVGFAIALIMGIFNRGGFASEVEILAVSKNESIAGNMDRILGNMEGIMHTLSFYDKILDQTDPDSSMEISDAEKKKKWNSLLTTKRVGNSDILTISFFDEDAMQAEAIVWQSAKNIAIEMSKIYNIKSELDVRIIDGPITYERSGEKSILNILWQSLLTGFVGGIAALVIFFLYEKIAGLYESGKIHWKIGRVKDEDGSIFEDSLFKQDFEKEKPLTEDVDYVFVGKGKYDQEGGMEKAEPEKPTAQDEQQRTQAEIKKKDIDRSKKASAPENLPIAGEDIMSLLGKNKSEPKKEKAENKSDIHREPTEEEVRERLNKLLGGGKF